MTLFALVISELLELTVLFLSNQQNQANSKQAANLLQRLSSVMVCVVSPGVLVRELSLVADSAGDRFGCCMIKAMD